MAVEIPVYVNISGAFDNAAREIPKEMPKLERAISKNILNIPIDVGNIKSVRDALIGTEVSAKDLKSVLSAISAEFNKQSKTEATAARTSAQVKNLAKAYALVEQRLTGVYNKSTAAAMMVTNSINKVKNKLAELRAQLRGETAGSEAFNKINYQIKIQEDRLRKLNLQYKQYQVYSGKAAASVFASFEKTNSAVSKQSALLKSITSLAATYLSIWQVARFIHNVREVTAEFEMQRVALAGIIQDTERAGLLFRQIKAAAIESPFQIKDLVTFTKQLSAYRIETEDLFDVTMKLADVSAGLGVDMNRLVLAYGQVRAASVLRGQELRQFTEAGIPLVELLAKKFTDLNGKMTSTADVFDLISRRAVPFEMIAEIFDDMTSAGGTFYQMQKKQAETLAGQWANLKDAASIMYDEIGNTDAVHNAMVGVINDAKFLMQNWRSIATILKTVGIQYAAMKVASLFLPKLAFDTQLAAKATDALARASALEAAQQGRSSIARGIAIKQLNAYSAAITKAAAAQTMFGRGMWKMAATMAGGGWIAAVITALTLLTGWLISARKEATRLNRDLEKIGNEGALSINRSIANFRRLADAAVDAAEGSDEQNKALAELQRTYSDIIPSQELQIEKLIALKGNYDSLTAAIEQKINMQLKEQKINAATDYYSAKIQRGRRNAKNLLEQYGLDKEQINAVFDEVQREVDNGMIKAEDAISTRSYKIEQIIQRLTGQVVSFGSGYRDYEDVWHNVYETNGKTARSMSSLVDLFVSLNRETASIEEEMNNSIGTMGVYAKSWDTLKAAIRDVTVSEFEFGKKSTYTYKKEKVRKQVDEISSAIQEAFRGTKIDISPALENGELDFDALNKFAEEAAGKGAFGLDKFIKNAQKSYEAIVPPENMVRVVEQKFKEVADTTGVTMDEVQGYLYRGGNDIRKYVKDLEDSLQSAKDKVAELNITKAQAPSLVSQEQLDNANALVTFLEAIVNWLSDFQKQGKKVAYQQDPFIAQMQNRMKFMQDFKKGYDDLRKYIGDSGALDEELKIMTGRGQALGIDVSQQKRAAEDLSAWYKEMIDLVSTKLRARGVTGASVTDLLGFDTSRRGKDVQEFQKLLQSLWDAKTDFDTSEMKKNFDEAMTRMKEEIKRSETVRDFYNDILGITGDADIATSMSVSVYGGIGNDFKENLQKELNAALESLDASSRTDVINKAFSERDFDTILKNMDKFPQEWQKRLKEMAAEDQKFNADLAKNLLQTLEKAKSYGQKRVEISQQTARRMQQIEELNADETIKAELRKQNAKKEAEDIAKLQYEAFKETPMYVELFSNLDRASTAMLRNMRDNIVKMKAQWTDLAPTEMKELQSRIAELDRQLATKNPFRELANGIKEYLTLSKEQSRGDADTKAVRATEVANAQKQALEMADKMYNATAKKFGVDSMEAKAAKKNLDIQKDKTDKAIEEEKAAQNTANAYRLAAKHIHDAAEGLGEWAGYVSTSLGGIEEIVGTFASDDFAETFNIISGGINKTLSGTATLLAGMSQGVLGIPQMIAGLGQIIGGIFGTAQQLKIKKANKEIERQADTIEVLEYQYGRLEKAIAKAFGSDYVTNYNQQLQNLAAQQEAYLKQAEAERSKGKKADEDKIKDYENSARDAADKILDMQSQLSEFFSGTDITSAAKDFANSWIEAYKEFGSTTIAMREKFQEMVQEMVEKSLAARVMQQLLSPIFSEIDRLAQEGGELSVADIAAIAQMADQQIPAINDAMLTLMNTLTQAGYNLRSQPGQFTGIARNIANASEESITGLAAGINTQNFYLSYMPTISANVAAILMHLTGGTADTTGATPITPTNNELVLAYMSTLPNIDANLAELLFAFKSVISPKSAATNTHYIAVRN